MLVKEQMSLSDSERGFQNSYSEDRLLISGELGRPRGVSKSGDTPVNGGFTSRVGRYCSRRKFLSNRIPIFIPGIILLMILLHYVLAKVQKSALEWKPGPWWNEPWRLLSYGLIHGDQKHLWINAVIAVVTGWPVECEQGWCRVGIVWVYGLLGGSLGASVFQPDSHVVGASAAVFAIITSHIPSICYLYGSMNRPWSTFRLVGVAMISGYEASRALTSLEGPIAWSAHLFGALVGVGVGFVVYSGHDERRPYERYCRVLFALLSLLLLAIAVYYHIRIHLGVSFKFV